MIEIQKNEIINYKPCRNVNYDEGGFYMILNKINNKAYIGKSINYMQRLKQHLYLSTNKTLIDIELNKENNNFSFFLILDYKSIGLNFFNRKLESIIEQKLIKEYKTNSPNGYNIKYYGWI